MLSMLVLKDCVNVNPCDVRLQSTLVDLGMPHPLNLNVSFPYSFRQRLCQIIVQARVRARVQAWVQARVQVCVQVWVQTRVQVWTQARV